MPGLQGLGGAASEGQQPGLGILKPWQPSSGGAGGGMPGMGLLSGLFGQNPGSGQQGAPTLSSLGLPDPLGQLLGKLGLPVPPLLPPGLPGMGGQSTEPAPAAAPAAPAQPAPDATAPATPVATTPAVQPAPQPAIPQQPGMVPGLLPPALMRMATGMLGAPNMGAGQQGMLRMLSGPFGWR